jgi:hypothetical protein
MDSFLASVMSKKFGSQIKSRKAQGINPHTPMPLSGSDHGFAAGRIARRNIAGGAGKRVSPFFFH